MTAWDMARQDPERYADWRAEVVNGDTLLGFEEWMNPELAGLAQE